MDNTQRIQSKPDAESLTPGGKSVILLFLNLCNTTAPDAMPLAWLEISEVENMQLSSLLSGLISSAFMALVDKIEI